MRAMGYALSLEIAEFGRYILLMARAMICL
jgi:hypothetical protein